jgi:O-antigen/teichoic acid export membrane protein
MAKTSIKKNYIFNLMYEILAIIVPFITTPYISRVLGATAVGDYNYINGIVSCFGLIVATGTATFGNRGIAVVQNDKKKRSVLFFEIFIFRVLCCGIALIPYTILIHNTTGLYHTLYLVNLLLFLSWILDVSWFCQGMENFAVTAIRNSIIKITGAVLIFVLIKQPSDLWKYTMIYSGSMLFGNMTMWFYVIRQIEWPGIKDIKVFRNTKEIIQLFIPVIAVQIYTVMDKTMLGYLDNTTQVGYYSQGQRIIELAITVINAFISVLLPRIAFLFNQNKKEELNQLIDKALQYVFLLSMPMIFGCITLIDWFVPIFFGNGYAPVGNVIKILSCMFVILSLGRLFGTMLIAINKQNQYTIVTIIAAVLNLVLNMTFIKYFHLGAIGVAFASVISEVVATTIQLWDVKGFVRIRTILKYMIKYAIPSILMMIVIISTRGNVITQSIVGLIIEAAIGMIVYLLVLLVFKDKIVFEVIGSINRNNK